MRVFIIDTTHMGPELQRGVIGVVGSPSPTPEEKKECVDTVSWYAVDGWAIAADLHTPIGYLAALTAEAAGAPFVCFGSARLPWASVRTMVADRSPERDSADLDRSTCPALVPGRPISGAQRNGVRFEEGGR